MVEEPYRKTLGAQHRVVDDDHPQAPTSTNGLGVLHTKKKQYDEVELLLIQALKGRRLKLGDPHPHTLESWRNLINLYKAWNKPLKKLNSVEQNGHKLKILKSDRTTEKSPSSRAQIRLD